MLQETNLSFNRKTMMVVGLLPRLFHHTDLVKTAVDGSAVLFGFLQFATVWFVVFVSSYAIVLKPFTCNDRPKVPIICISMICLES